MSDAERRADWDGWLANRVGLGLTSPLGESLSALGQPYQRGVNMAGQWQPFNGVPILAKRRYRPRGAWKKLRRCKCRCNG